MWMDGAGMALFHFLKEYSRASHAKGDMTESKKEYLTVKCKILRGTVSRSPRCSEQVGYTNVFNFMKTKYS